MLQKTYTLVLNYIFGFLKSPMLHNSMIKVTRYQINFFF